jgi:hypothetical protein
MQDALTSTFLQYRNQEYMRHYTQTYGSFTLRCDEDFSKKTCINCGMSLTLSTTILEHRDRGGNLVFLLSSECPPCRRDKAAVRKGETLKKSVCKSSISCANDVEDGQLYCKDHLGKHDLNGTMKCDDD